MPTAVLLRGAPPQEACRSAALVVSAEPVRGPCLAQVVDRFAVWRDGPHAIWLDPAGIRVVSDRGFRGNRPWVPPVPHPRGTASAEPRAVVE
jgi:competence protein ComEC